MGEDKQFGKPIGTFQMNQDMIAQMSAEIEAAGGLEPAYEELNRLAAAAPPGCDGLVLLPFFAGAYSPENDMNAKGLPGKAVLEAATKLVGE